MPFCNLFIGRPS